MDNLNEWLKPQLIWFGVGFILLLAEFVNPGVIMMFFGIGAWIVAFVCLFIDISINLQLTLFIISSLVLLIVFRNKFRTLFQQRLESDRNGQEILSEFLGQKAVVTKEITPKTPGKVEFRGTHWAAEAGQTVPKGTSVEIIDKRNITLIVNPL